MSENIKHEELAEVQPLEILGATFNMYGDPDDPLFLAVDIAELLEYSEGKAHQLLELVDDNEKLTDTIHRKGQNREVWFVTEYGLYEILMQSRKPLAKAFKLQIKSVLHKIRTGKIQLNRVVKTGGREITIENAKLMPVPFKNFSGEASQYNRAGDRNFCVVIEDLNIVDQMIKDGWNIKVSKPKNEEYDIEHYVQVTVRFDNFPPDIYLISGGVQTRLEEDQVSQLDRLDYDKVHLTINGSVWLDDNKNKRIKAYLKEMYIFAKEKYLTNKYGVKDEDNQLPF